MSLFAIMISGKELDSLKNENDFKLLLICWVALVSTSHSFLIEDMKATKYSESPLSLELELELESESESFESFRSLESLAFFRS
jgi:hypothetical protein